jgi:hypothetical protein
MWPFWRVDGDRDDSAGSHGEITGQEHSVPGYGDHYRSLGGRFFSDGGIPRAVGAPDAGWRPSRALRHRLDEQCDDQAGQDQHDRNN